MTSFPLVDDEDNREATPQCPGIIVSSQRHLPPSTHSNDNQQHGVHQASYDPNVVSKTIVIGDEISLFHLSDVRLIPLEDLQCRSLDILESEVMNGFLGMGSHGKEGLLIPRSKGKSLPT